MSKTYFVIGENVKPVDIIGKEEWRSLATSKQEL